MELSPKKMNSFIIFKLPSAWLCGVRVKHISEADCTTSVKHRWINQNPFNSLYFAVQAMAAELSTGALVMNAVQKSGKSFSMLVTQNSSRFSRKATGRIDFLCADAEKVKVALRDGINTGEGQSFWMTSIGTNEEGEEVSRFEFEWSIKLRN